MSDNTEAARDSAPALVGVIPRPAPAQGAESPKFRVLRREHLGPGAEAGANPVDFHDADGELHRGRFLHTPRGFLIEAKTGNVVGRVPEGVDVPTLHQAEGDRLSIYVPSGLRVGSTDGDWPI